MSADPYYRIPGIGEQEFLTSMKNLVNSRGDELRNALASVGLSESEAAQFEKELYR